MHSFFVHAEHNVGEIWEVKHQQGLSLEYAVHLDWDQISRGRFFLHEHPATATSWGLSMVEELERHLGFQVVTGDMCRWGMTLEKDITGDEPVKLVKKPSKWMTNSPISRTKQAESYPVSLIKAILNRFIRPRE